MAQRHRVKTRVGLLLFPLLHLSLLLLLLVLLRYWIIGNRLRGRGNLRSRKLMVCNYLSLVPQIPVSLSRHPLGQSLCTHPRILIIVSDRGRSLIESIIYEKLSDLPWGTCIATKVMD